MMLLFLVAGALAQTEKTCDDMGWSDEVVTGGLGIEGVCGTKGDETVCTGEVTYEAAETVCTDMGIRLCYRAEYEALEAFDSGCKYEKKSNYVWTSTECGSGKNKGYLTVKLSKAGAATSECVKNGEKAFGGRCCADVGVEETMSPTAAPTSKSPTAAPTLEETMSPTAAPTMAPVESMAPTERPTEDPAVIDEIMAELICIAASGSKRECKHALPKTAGKCKYYKGPNYTDEDRCQLKDFWGACASLNKKDCKDAVEEGRCEFVDDKEKECKEKEE